jgi:hypothetical protein
MKQVLINVSYDDPTGKFWWESSIKKKVVDFDPEKQSIHDVIKELCAEEDYMELSYKGKPRANVFRDTKDGSEEIVGYIYRGKGEVHDRNMVKPVMVFWDVWVTLKAVEKFEFETIG